MENVATMLENQQYDELIKSIKNQRDPRIFTDTTIKKWCGMRWRNFFIANGVLDSVALETAQKVGFFQKKKTHEPPKKLIAERYLRAEGPTEWELELPEAPDPNSIKLSNTTLLLCPGLLNGLLPVRAFQEALPAVEEKYGWSTLRADLHPMRSCEANIADLENAIEKGLGLQANTTLIEEEDAIPPKDVMIIAYSKGAPDVLAFLVQRPDLAKRVRCIFHWAGAIGGSYLADDSSKSLANVPLEEIQEKTGKVLPILSPFIKISDSLRRFDEFDIRNAVLDLTTTVRGKFVNEHKEYLDSLNIPFFNLTGSTTDSEVPYFQIQAAKALNKYDANNDMQLTQEQSKLPIPMATDLAMMHGHHWDISYSPFPKNMRFGSPHLDHPFPKEAALTAMVQLAYELGLID